METIGEGIDDETNTVVIDSPVAGVTVVVNRRAMMAGVGAPQTKPPKPDGRWIPSILTESGEAVFVPLYK